MFWVVLLLLFLVSGVVSWFVLSRLFELSARLDYLSDVVDYLCTSLGHSEASEILEDLEDVLAYFDDVPDDMGVIDVSSEDGSLEDVQR